MLKKEILVVAVILLLLGAIGCSKADSKTPPASENSSKSASGSNADGSTPVQLTDEQRDNELYNLLWPLSADGRLTTSWEGSPKLPIDDLFPRNFEVRTAAKNPDGSFTITIEFMAFVYLLPDSMTESISDTQYADQSPPVPILSQGLEMSPQLPVGKSEVRVSSLAPDGKILACSYTAYQNPGITYLKAQTEAMRPQLESSQKLDTAQYSAPLVQYIWHELMALRYIEKPEDITLYDLENFHGSLVLNYSTFDMVYDDPSTPPMDVSLLRLMANVESVDLALPIQDYSVFEKMQKLEKLSIIGLDDKGLSSLRVGHTNMLDLSDFSFGELSLNGVNADALSIFSWGKGVSAFKGCENIKSLYINSTRTDMRLVNKEAFPNAAYLNLQFYSDTERVRDFSRLATFTDAKIDLMLSYQACNNKTLESLAGVPLRLLVLDPENGSYPLPWPDEAIIAAIPAQRVERGRYLYFEELALDSM